MKSDSKFAVYGALFLVSVIGLAISLSQFFKAEDWEVMFASYGIIISGCSTAIFLVLTIYHARKIKDLPDVDREEILQKMAYEEERERYNL